MAHQPHNLVATPISTTEIELSWDDVDTLDDESFDIERDSVIVEVSWTGGTTYTDTGLDPDTEYTYRVRAVGGLVPSEPVVTPTTVAARATIFTPVITVVADASVTPTTVSAVAVVFTPGIATTISTVTPATVVGSVSVETPTITGETYSDSYGLDYGETEGVANVTPSTVVTASTVVTPTITTVFDPTSITGLVAWYDASDISTLWQDGARTSAISSDGQAILGISDKSGSGNHLSATNGPAYKTAIMNSQSVARFDGTNDRIFGTYGVSQVQPNTIFVVADRIGTGNAYVLDGVITSARHALYVSTTAGTGFFYGGTVIATPTVGMTPFVASMVINGASSQMWLNGTSHATGSAGNHQMGGISLGSDWTPGSYFNGDIAEVLVYDSALGTTDRDNVEAYLGSKWGITVA